MKHPKVDEFIENTPRWQEEITLLRQIVLECGLQESYKWKQPCYAHNGRNISMVSYFKNAAFISFFKAALLKDSAKILEFAGENSQVSKLMKFSNVGTIKKSRQTIERYIYEAIEIEKLGLKIKTKNLNDYDLPEELREMFQTSPDFQAAFQDLTPGRQKGYLLHFS